MPRLQRIAAGVIVSALALVASACASSSSDSSGSSGSGAAEMHLTVGYVVGTEVELFYALNENLFAKQGLEVKPVQFTSGPPMLAALANGSIQAGVFGLPPMIGASTQSVPFKVWDLTDHAGNLNGLYVRPGSGIKSLRDLEGKTVATASGTTADIIMHIALRQAGVPFNSVHIKYLAPPELVDAYVRKDVNAVWIWNNWGQRLVGAGATLIADARQYGQDDPGIAVSTDQVIQANKPALAAYMRATDQAAQVINADPTNPAVIAALSKYSGLSPSLAKQMMSKETNPVITSGELRNPSFELSFVRQSGFAKLATSEANMMKTLGLINTAPPVSDLFTTSVLDSLKAK